MKNIFRNITFLLFTLLCTVVFSSCIKMFDSKWWEENGWNGVEFGDITTACEDVFINSTETKTSHTYKISNLYKGGDYIIILSHVNAYNNGTPVSSYNKNDVMITVAYDSAMTNEVFRYDAGQHPLPFNNAEGPDDWDRSTIYVKLESKNHYEINVDFVIKALIRKNGSGPFDTSPYMPVVTEL